MSSGIGQHENDKRWMRAALAEARKAEGRTGTNPPVGCVLISPDNKLIAAGHTKPNGRPHAEAVALAEAGSAGLAHRVVGGTAYVTLEPCAHHGKTPPCAEALRDAGIAAGLEAPMAAQLASQTVYGAALYATRAEDEPGALREQVTSPNGTTAAALKVLMDPDNGLTQLMTKAVLASRDRSIELGQ